MNITKIRLSSKEAELINNTEWILTKHNLIEKVYQVFGELNELMKNQLALFDYLPEHIQRFNGKISRGENYKLLPYIILDYPYYFKKNEIFAVRTMFWWGNFFSITLHLSGDHKAKFVSNHPDLLTSLKKNNFFICVNKEEWQHDFDEKNYLPAANFTLIEFNRITRKTFFKVSKKISLNQWDYAQIFIMEAFMEILGLLQINFQGDRKDLLPGFPITGSGL